MIASQIEKNIIERISEKERDKNALYVFKNSIKQDFFDISKELFKITNSHFTSVNRL